jgi:hypothetical protein
LQYGPIGDTVGAVKATSSQEAGRKKEVSVEISLMTGTEGTGLERKIKSINLKPKNVDIDIVNINAFFILEQSL